MSKVQILHKSIIATFIILWNLLFDPSIKILSENLSKNHLCSSWPPTVYLESINTINKYHHQTASLNRLKQLTKQNGNEIHII